MERSIAAAERLLVVATMGPALPPKLPPQLSAHAPRMAASLRPRVTVRGATCSSGPTRAPTGRGYGTLGA